MTGAGRSHEDVRRDPATPARPVDRGESPLPHTNMLEADLAALVVVDVQEKIFGAISSMPREGLLANIVRLIDMAGILGIPVLLTEQYPKGLGVTVSPIRDRLPGVEPIVKTMCSCWRDEGFRSALQRTGREHVILVGVEAHVCIQQTALDLLRVDYVPFVTEDAVGSRRLQDATVALGRMGRAGVVNTTTETVIFELIERCDHPRFKDALKLVK